ncbi:MAG: hypothetical protein HN403_17645 [Rhodospirillales bacterium]|jgi:hypothetical protein|nr:hypothetical protein [Rhodospirillales bacterium]
MADIGSLWAGRVYGTNTGNLFVKLVPSEDGVTGTLRFMDSIFGIVVYELTGNFVDGKLSLMGEPTQAAPGVEVGKITVDATLQQQGGLHGEWNTELGTAGTFELFPHDLRRPNQVDQAGSPVPEQFHTSRLTVGAVRLYLEDVRGVSNAIRKDFSVGRVIVTYKISGIDRTRYFEDFEKDVPADTEIQYLKLIIQEPEAHGINKLVIVELDSQGRNDVIVQSINESWAIGRSESLVRHMQRYEKSLVTNFRKFGLGLNQIIFAAMLVLIPEVETITERAIFAFIVFGLLMGIVWAHQRFLPNVIVSFSVRKPGIIKRMWPVFLSWLIAATASLAAALAFYLLTKDSS